MSQRVDIGSVPQVTADFADLKFLLAEIVRAVQPKLILEIGTDVGDSTRIFSALLQENGGHLWTVDIKPPEGNWLATWPLKNVTSIQGDSRLLQWAQKVDLLYLDGDHTTDTVAAELNNLGPWVRAGGKILLHDTLHNQFGQGIITVIHAWTKVHRLPWTQYPYQHGLGLIEVTHDLVPAVPMAPALGARVG